MYEIRATPMVYSIQIYDSNAGQSASDRTRYSTSMLLTDLALGECRLHFVQGILNHEINSRMADLCRQLGYRRIQFEVPRGTSASRYGEYRDTYDGLDRYVVDLEDVD